MPRFEANLDGYHAYGTTPTRAARLLYRLIAWHDAPDGWRSRLAWWRYLRVVKADSVPLTADRSTVVDDLRRRGLL